MNEIETRFFEVVKGYFTQSKKIEILNDSGSLYFTIKTKEDKKSIHQFFFNALGCEFKIIDNYYHRYDVKKELIITPQGDYSINGYKPDFVFSCGDLMYAIEIDGFEWHEKTKEQAINDRKKDRAYLKSNIIPIRFLGKEIYHNATDCLKEILEIIGENIYNNERIKQGD